MPKKTQKPTLEQNVQDILNIILVIKNKLGSVQTDLSELRFEFDDFRIETRKNFLEAQLERSRIESKVDYLSKNTQEDIDMLIQITTKHDHRIARLEKR